MSNANNQGIKDKTISGLFWRFAERCGAEGVTFIVSIVLARLLDPSDYGLIAMVTVFIAISKVFVDSGMGNALIQKKMRMNWIFLVFFISTLLYALVYMLCFLCFRL